MNLKFPFHTQSKLFHSSTTEPAVNPAERTLKMNTTTFASENHKLVAAYNRRLSNALQEARSLYLDRRPDVKQANATRLEELVVAARKDAAACTRASKKSGQLFEASHVRWMKNLIVSIENLYHQNLI